MRISDWSSDVCSSDLVKNREQYAFGQGHQRGGLDPGRDEKVAASRGGQMPHDFARAETIAVGLDRCAARRAAALRGEPAPVGDEGFGRQAKAERRRNGDHFRSEEHTAELQSLMRISYAVFCLKKKRTQ